MWPHIKENMNTCTLISKLFSAKHTHKHTHSHLALERGELQVTLMVSERQSSLGCSYEIGFVERACTKGKV